MSTQNHTEIADWVGDIVALESHVEEAMDHQLKMEVPNAELKATIQELHDACRDSKHRAEQYQEQLGTTAGNPVIKVGTEMLGKAAGLIDRVRKDSASKALRDNAPAFGLLNVSYAMLYTTARALEDEATAAFADQGMRTYAHLTQKANAMLPLAVVEDLKANDNTIVVNESVVSSARDAIHAAWNDTEAS